MAGVVAPHRRGRYRRRVRVRRVRRGGERRLRAGRPRRSGGRLCDVERLHGHPQGDLVDASAARPGPAPADRQLVRCLRGRGGCDIQRWLRGDRWRGGPPAGRRDADRCGRLGRRDERLRRGCGCGGTARRLEHRAPPRRHGRQRGGHEREFARLVHPGIAAAAEPRIGSDGGRWLAGTQPDADCRHPRRRRRPPTRLPTPTPTPTRRRRRPRRRPRRHADAHPDARRRAPTAHPDPDADPDAPSPTPDPDADPDSDARPGHVGPGGSWAAGRLDGARRRGADNRARGARGRSDRIHPGRHRGDRHLPRRGRDGWGPCR